MGEKYISPYDTIGKMREEIKQLLKAAGASYQGTDQQQTRIEAGVYIRPMRFLFYEERSQE